MMTKRDQDLALLTALRAARAVEDARERAARLAEARRWDDYLCTTFDQLTTRAQRPAAAPKRGRAA